MTEQPPPESATPPPVVPPAPPAGGWAPAPLSAGGSVGYLSDPNAHRPTAAPQHPSAQIERYAPKRNLSPLIAALASLTVAGLVAYTALNPPTLAPTTTPSATRSPSASAKPRDGVPFTVQFTGITGVWKISEHRWDAQGVAAFVEVRVDTGELDCYFNALSNNGQDVVRGEAGSLAPAFPGGTVSAGTTASGWVYFPIRRGTTLVFLRTGDQAQVSGIEVTG